jgi:hypothetical protein
LPNRRRMQRFASSFRVCCASAVRTRLQKSMASLKTIAPVKNFFLGVGAYQAQEPIFFGTNTSLNIVKSHDLLDSKGCPNRQGMFSRYTSAISTESCLTSFRNLRLSTLDSLASHLVITYFHCPQCEFTNLCGGLKDSVSLYTGSSARDKQLLASISIVPEKP